MKMHCTISAITETRPNVNPVYTAQSKKGDYKKSAVIRMSTQNHRYNSLKGIGNSRCVSKWPCYE